MEQLQKALLEQPDENIILRYIGASYKRLGKFEQSLATNKKALSLDPESISTVNEVIQNLILSHKIDEAFKQVKIYLKKFPNSANLQSLLARLYFEYDGDVDNYLKIHNSLFIKSKDIDPLYFRLQVNNENIEELSKTLEQLKTGDDPVNDAFVDAQLSELFNLTGDEEKSQHYAAKALEVLNNNSLNKNTLAYNPLAKQRYGFKMYLSCLANDQVSYKNTKEKFQSIKDSENNMRVYYGFIYASALAECGETDKAWEIMKNIPGQTFARISEWTLALDPLYQHYFSEIPEYQAMVKRLKQEKLKKESVK